MRVGGIDENVCGGNTGRRFDLCDGRVDDAAWNPQHVAGNNREFRIVLFKNDRDGAELAFLVLDEPRIDVAGNDHGLIGAENHRGRTDAKVGEGVACA